MENVDVTVIARWRKDGNTYSEISERLQQMYPCQRGFSERTVSHINGLEKHDENEIDEIVAESVEEVN